MQCVDVAGLQKYAMAQADTKCSNAGAAKRQERCVCVCVWPKSRQLVQR